MKSLLIAFVATLAFLVTPKAEARHYKYSKHHHGYYGHGHYGHGYGHSPYCYSHGRHRHYYSGHSHWYYGPHRVVYVTPGYYYPRYSGLSFHIGL